VVVVVQGHERKVGTHGLNDEVAHEDGVLSDGIETLRLGTEATYLREGACDVLKSDLLRLRVVEVELSTARCVEDIGASGRGHRTELIRRSAPGPLPVLRWELGLRPSWANSVAADGLPWARRHMTRRTRSTAVIYRRGPMARR